MGCDIHALVERKVGDKWVMVNRIEGPATYRNYKRFAALAGVRGDGPAPLGLPHDISDSGRLYADELGSDGHSHSFLDLREAARLFADTEPNPSPFASTSPCGAFFGIYDGTSELHRLVFWFDN